MKTIKTLVSAMLVLAFVLAAIPAFAAGKDTAAPAEVSGNTFYNDYITFTVNSYGGVSRYENAAGQDLLYDRSSSTSYTTIHINGNNYRYDDRTMTVSPSFVGNTNYSATTIDGIQVEQRLTPVANDLGHESIVEWHYTYTNTPIPCRT